MLLTGDIEKVTNYNWLYVVVGVLLFLIVVKYVWELIEWYIKKAGIQLKGKEQEKTDREIIKATSIEVSSIKESIDAINDSITTIYATTQELTANQEMINNNINTVQNDVMNLQALTNKLSNTQDDLHVKINNMEESEKNYRMSDVRNELIKQYRYFTNKHNNPMLAWTNIEKHAFDSLYSVYEGNSYVHDTVKPAMDNLDVIDMSDVARLTKLYASRSKIEND